jgi:hypothetical protein
VLLVALLPTFNFPIPFDAVGEGRICTPRRWIAFVVDDRSFLICSLNFANPVLTIRSARL